MIIKSMARKDPSFEQLVSYMEKDDSDRVVFHNFFGHDRIRTEEIVKEFSDNARHLPRRKNGNSLYHEILSLNVGHSLDRGETKRILSDIAHEYLKLRAPDQLAYGTLHRDTDHLHLHICISANPLGKSKRVRLAKRDFADIQKGLESFVRERYPELNQERVYTKGRERESVKTASREQAYKERTGGFSRKEEIAGLLHGLFEYAGTRKELDALLARQGFRLYERGKTAGLVGPDGKKHRLKTLGLDLHFSAALERFGAPDDRARSGADDRGPEGDARGGRGAGSNGNAAGGGEGGRARDDRDANDARSRRKEELDSAFESSRDREDRERTR